MQPGIETSSQQHMYCGGHQPDPRPLATLELQPTRLHWIEDRFKIIIIKKIHEYIGFKTMSRKETQLILQKHYLLELQSLIV